MSARPPSAPTPRGHLPSLDGLRGVAVLLVLLFHFTHLDAPGGPVERALVEAARVGWSGVDLFFVLSGFLITGILLDAKNGRNYFRNFYLRRALRIFPLYYAYLAVLFLVLPSIVAAARLDPRGDTQAWMWSYLGNVLFAMRRGFEASPHAAHFWSLAVEEQFYLVWPLLVWLLPRRGLVWACAAAIVGAFTLRAGILKATWNATAAYVLTPCRMDALATGALVAAIVREGGLARLRRLAPAVLGFSALVIAALWLRRGTFFGGDPTVQVWGFTALAVLYGSVLVLALTLPAASPLGRTLAHPFLRTFGKYSYALYVLHYPLFHVLEANGLSASAIPPVFGSRLPGLLLFVSGATALSYLAALASWHLIEKRFLALKARLPYER
jgi:peptidoglycan/LPS O-acetylase OafA/YrhL